MNNDTHETAAASVDWSEDPLTELLIGRDWYELSEWNLTDDGHCTSCGTQCADVFAGRPGHWGRKRQPIWMTTAD